jgi:arylsulfatase A-like enzyme
MGKLIVRFFMVFGMLILLFGLAHAKDTRPNILLIVADDLGYSDLGSYGGEFKTPVIDQLAADGVRYTDFYVSPACATTRAMLLTGTDHHVAGLGSFENFIPPDAQGKPGYEGWMNHQVVTVASLLRDGGYHTYLAGKWHLGYLPDQIPRARGFERDFALLPGAADHFSDGWSNEWQRAKAPYTEDGQFIEELPRDFYSTKNYTDKMIQFIDEGRKDGQPFFGFLSYTAPHGPLQVPKDWLRRYKNTYDMGWDTVRHARFRRMKELGIVAEDVEQAQRLWFLPRSTQLMPAVLTLSGRKFGLYRSMTEYMDMEIGRLLAYLKKIGEYDNTLIVFISDNGAEGNDEVQILAGRPGTQGYLHAARNFAESHFNRIGHRGTFAEVGPAWAQTSSTPFRLFKAHVTEGGIRAPLIVSGPGVKGDGTINTKAILHVMDLAPTFLELAGLTHPKTYKGRTVAPIQGKSLVSMLKGEAESPRGPEDWLGWELFGGRAIRKGDWKISWLPQPFGQQHRQEATDWKLYNLAKDPAEQHNLSDQDPKKRQELMAHWEEYVEQSNVIVSQWNMLEIMARKGLPDPYPSHDNFPPTYAAEELIRKAFEKQGGGQ